MPTEDQPADEPPRRTIESAAAQILRSLDGTSRPEDAADLLIPLSSVELRSIPREEWRTYVLRDVTLPPDCVAFVEGQRTFTRTELDSLEDRIAAYHGVTEPFYITAESSPIFSAWLGVEKI